MKCQILCSGKLIVLGFNDTSTLEGHFVSLCSGKNRKNISKCCLLKILPRVLGIKRGIILTKLVQFFFS